jgi:hypothetical protein
VNYAKSLPKDKSGESMQEFPAPALSVTRHTTTNAVASSVISLSGDTTTVEVGAFGGQGAVIRWIPLTETAAVGAKASVIASGAGVNYDHYIPPSTVRRFVVPRETQGLPGPIGVGSMVGLYQRMARINAGIVASSVLVSEF